VVVLLQEVVELAVVAVVVVVVAVVAVVVAVVLRAVVITAAEELAVKQMRVLRNPPFTNYQNHSYSPLLLLSYQQQFVRQ
jgi:uncharacterized membrane protein YqiK